MALANYFPYPGVPMRPTFPVAGLSGTGGSAGSMLGGLAWFAINAGCGYYIGQYFNKPVAGAALTAFLGLPGLVVLALISDNPASAIPNRRRRRHGRRRGCGRRAGGWR